MSQSISAQPRSPASVKLRVPGPKGTFFWGSLPELRKDMLGLYRDAAREYGDVVRLRFAGVDTFMFSHPDHFKYVLQDNHRNYRRNQFFNSIIKTFVGTNLFTSDGDDWLSRRRLMQPAFHRQRISGFGELMTAATANMLERWQAGQDGRRLEIDQEMMAITLQIAGQALFSIDLHGEASELGEAFTALSEYVNYRFGHPFVPPMWVPTHANRRLVEARRVLDRRIQAMIRERRQNAGERGDLLDMLMAARDADTGLGMTDEQLQHEIAVMMFAGHETTAAALTWAFYLLSQNPAVLAKLRAELDANLAGRVPAVRDLPQLPYNRMIVDEALRLYPPALGITRQTIRPDEVGGYRIPAGAGVSLIFFNVHRDPRFWVNPERFDPERFTPERSAGRHAFAYLPFGAGPRLCIGNQFALTEAQIVLAAISQRFDLALLPGHPVRPNPLFITRTSNGLPMTVRRRA